MKFSPFSWREVKAREEFQVSPGMLRVRCAPQGALYLDCQGVQSLVGFGSAFDVEIAEEMTAHVVGFEPGIRVFVYEAEPTAAPDSGEVFSNIDRLPNESGAVLEVRRALRDLELARRAGIDEMRAQRASFERERAALLAAAAPDPAKPEPAKAAPDPVVE